MSQSLSSAKAKQANSGSHSKQGKLPALASHLRDPEQRADIARLGMWLFLSTEVLFFGVLFLGFTAYRHLYRADFIAASARLHVWLGSINTLVLLTSSLFVALAVRAAQRGERRAASRFLMVTLALALIFLSIKGYEWLLEYREQLVPGINFSLPQIDPTASAHQQLFFCFYFIMTGLHGLHMLMGVGVMIWLIFRCRLGRDELEQTLLIRIESLALYWHFVDIVWVFLLPLLYLTGFTG